MNLTKLEQKDIMDEIVPVYTTDTDIKVVNARELHQALGVKKDFTSWIKTNLKNYETAESVENKPFTLKGECEIDAIRLVIPATNSTPKKVEYILTLNTAKEIAMMSRCEKGRAIRKYFIEIEKAYNSTIQVLASNELSDEEKIAEALMISQNLLEQTKKELAKANKNKEYNKKVNTKLRREIRLLKAELERAQNNPMSSSEEIENIKNKLEEAQQKADYWEGAYANLEIKLDSQKSQLETILAVKKDGKKYFNALAQKHAAAILINDADKRSMKANVFRKTEIEKNTNINYNNRFTSNFIDRIHPKSIPLALSTYLTALEKRLGSNFETVIGEKLINEVREFLRESDDNLDAI